MHQRSIEILNEATTLHQSSNNFQVKILAEASVQYIDIAHEWNKNGFLLEAEYCIDYSAATLHIAKEISIGIAQGVYEGIESTFHCITHPVETATGIVEGVASLGKAIFYMSMQMCELEILYETNPELGLNRAKEIQEQFRPIRHEIKKRISELTLQDCARLPVRIVTEITLQGKFLQTTSRVINALDKGVTSMVTGNPLAKNKKFAMAVTSDGSLVKIKKTSGFPKNSPMPTSLRSFSTTEAAVEINQTSEAILKNGYYEVNGFKFSEYYYNRLWSKGRPAPTFRASSILEHSKEIIPDKLKHGYYRYTFDGWEMVYNPTTKEVWHLGPIKLDKALE